MFSHIFFLLVIFLNKLCWHNLSAQLYVPPISCPQYFEYLSQGSTYFGKITLSNISPGSTKVFAQFSQRENVVTPNYYGRLSLYEDKQTTVNKLYSGEPILYRVDFPNPNVLPKLTQISVNNVVVCSNSAYPPPNYSLQLTHTISLADLGASLVPYQSAQNTQIVTAPSNSRRSEVRRPIQSQPSQQRQQQTTQIQHQHQQQQQQRTTQYADCGLENRVITPFIVGGELLSPRQFPWLAAIYINFGGSLKFTCGGTLVTARTVITAAHCFTNAVNNIEVHLGHYDLEDYSETFETRRVQQLIKHPEFHSTTLPDADIAILHLHSSVSFSSSIRPICLWSAQSNDVNSLVGQKAVVAGWGEDATRTVQTKPKKANANIVTASECQSALQRNFVPASSRSICVRNTDGSTPCRGDSGGGLAVFQNGRWILRGIISGGNSNDRGCLIDYAFFCDLAQHKTWLFSNII